MCACMYPLEFAMYPLPIDCIEKNKKKKIKSKKRKKSKNNIHTLSFGR